MVDEKMFRHIIRYGTVADQMDMVNMQKTYDTVVINANMLAHATGAVSKFVLENVCLINNKSYFIDPITYAFQQDLQLLHTAKKKEESDSEIEWKQRSIKASILKLIAAYGKKATCILENRPISFSDFVTEADYMEFCEPVLNFQSDIVCETVKNQDIAEYIEFAEGKALDQIEKVSPEFLIAPYFYLDSKDLDNWLKANSELVKASLKLIGKNKESRIWAQIMISPSVLREKRFLDKVIDTYKCLACGGITIWLDGFKENMVDEKDVEHYIYLLKGLQGKPIYNMYGGFFSFLLGHKEIGLLSGVSHGLEYGENRSGYPVGGGVPASKYYFFPLHQRLKYSEALDLLIGAHYIDEKRDDWGKSQGYLKDICRCKTCQELVPEVMRGFEGFQSREPYTIEYKSHVQRRLKASKEVKANCRYHYLQCKNIEVNMMKRKSLKWILERLRQDVEKYKTFTYHSEKYIKHIYIWIKALSKLEE